MLSFSSTPVHGTQVEQHIWFWAVLRRAHTASTKQEPSSVPVQSALNPVANPTCLSSPSKPLTRQSVSQLSHCFCLAKKADQFKCIATCPVVYRLAVLLGSTAFLSEPCCSPGLLMYSSQKAYYRCPCPCASAGQRHEIIPCPK